MQVNATVTLRVPCGKTSVRRPEPKRDSDNSKPIVAFVTVILNIWTRLMTMCIHNRQMVIVIIITLSIEMLVKM